MATIRNNKKLLFNLSIIEEELNKIQKKINQTNDEKEIKRLKELKKTLYLKHFS